MSDWQGKMPPSYCAPLTVAWFKSVTTPRHDVDGTVSYVLTPPRSKGIPWLGIGVLIAIGLMTAGFIYGAWAR